MTTYDNHPSFAVDVGAGQAYQTDLEALSGTLSAYTNVIELGCGSGVFTQFLKSNLQTVVGVDKSEAQLVQAQQRLPDVEFINADFTSRQFVEDMAKRGQYFDLIVTRYVIHELEDPIETFLLWKSFLADGGKILFIENTWIRRDWGWSNWGQLTDSLPLACTQTWATGAYCLKKAGFTI